MHSDPLLDPVRLHVAALGFELIEFRRSGPPERPLIQVRIDRPDSTPGHGVTVEDCVRVSRLLERLLESSGEIGIHYALRISSPGIERPVRFPEHWRRVLGREVRLKARGLSGEPRAVVLEVPDDDHVRLRLMDGREFLLALDDLKHATLLMESAPPGVA
jgi:ribosome maturation factor RimP